MTTPTTVNVRLQLRADTAANWTAANPTLLANEVALETDTKKLKVGSGSTAWNSLAYFPSIVTGGTVLGNLEIGSTGTLTFEGSTADGFETTLAVTNPTADRTITLPNQSGTVVVSGNASIVDADIAATAEIAVSKLANGTANQVLVTDGTDVSWSDNLTLAGDLTVNGTTTTISTQNLLVEDKNIIIGDVATPTDVTADGGGITLKGTTDKTINWVDATDAWTSSERFSVPLGSAALPSLTFTGDPNTGIYSPGANQVAISTDGSGRIVVGSTGTVNIVGAGTAGATQAVSFNGSAPVNSLVIDSSGRLLVGTSSSSTADSLVLQGNSSNRTVGGADVRLRKASLPNADSQGLGTLHFEDNSGNVGARIAGISEGAWTSGSNHRSRLVFSTTADGASSPTERMWITSGGNLLLGGTLPASPNITLSAGGSITCGPIKASRLTSDVQSFNTASTAPVTLSYAAGATSLTVVYIGTGSNPSTTQAPGMYLVNRESGTGRSVVTVSAAGSVASLTCDGSGVLTLTPDTASFRSWRISYVDVY